jgi:MFS transporter, ACS family, hexuronate transporter
MENHQSKIGNYRWVIITLLLFSTTINYMDRQVISYLKPFFCTAIDQGGFGWSNTDFSFLTSFFTGIYAFMTIIVGSFIDKIGTKLGLAISLVTWSVFGIVNAFAGAAISVHVFIRSLFAVGEAGNFPASNKTVAEWFPKKERALATGIFNAGASVGAMISALLVPGFLTYFGLGAGWKMSFIVTGASGFLWLIFWFVFYNSPEKQKRLSKPELEYILQDDKEDQAISQVKSEEEKTKVPWMKLWKYRQTWSFFWGKFFTDGVWWFYLFWLPDYLIKQFGMTTLETR